MGSLRVACSRPVRIQLVAVGLDILRNAQASSSVRLCDSMVTPIKETSTVRGLLVALCWGFSHYSFSALA